MPYQSSQTQTQSQEVPSQSSGIWGSLLGGAVGLAVGVATGNPALGFGVGSALGGGLGSLDTDTVSYDVAAPYDQTARTDLSQYMIQPMPQEDPSAYHARISNIFRMKSDEAARSFYG